MPDMPEPASPDVPDRPASTEAAAQKWLTPATVATVATITQLLLAAAAAWFLLSQLAPIVRPFMIAVFLAYVLMPYHSRLRKQIGSPASIGVLAGVTATVLFVLAISVYASVLGLSDD